MSSKPKVVPVGSLVVDARELDGLITDLPRGSMRGMLGARKGYEEVVAEIVSNQSTNGEDAGITDKDFRRLEELNTLVAKLDKYLPAVAKLHELIVESRAMAEDERQRLVFAFAQSVESRAKARRSEGLLAFYEKTRAYRSAAAFKAVKTRRKNAALASAHEEIGDQASEVETSNE